MSNERRRDPGGPPVCLCSHAYHRASLDPAASPAPSCESSPSPGPPAVASFARERVLLRRGSGSPCARVVRVLTASQKQDGSLVLLLICLRFFAYCLHLLLCFVSLRCEDTYCIIERSSPHCPVMWPRLPSLSRPRAC